MKLFVEVVLVIAAATIITTFVAGVMQ